MLLKEGNNITTTNGHSNMARMQIVSPASTKSVAMPTNNCVPSNNPFMRGLFKSSSVNYGSNMLRRGPIDVGQAKSPLGVSRQSGPLSPQSMSITPGRKYMLAHHHSPTSVVVNTHRSYQSSPHSADTVSLSHEEHEKDSEGNILTRSRITISNNCIAVANEEIKTLGNTTLGTVKENGNINIQISNVINNNNSSESSGSNTNGDTNNSNSTSNSIWYEYGCV